MLISCPKCNSVYNISDTRVPMGGKKFKCAECGEVWKVLPQDVNPSEPESKGNISSVSGKKENDDINVMFSRLSRDTKNLFAGENAVENMTPADKLRHFCRNFFSIYVIAAFLLVLSIVLAVYLFYQKRYEIVAHIPGMEKVYGRFGIESVYAGRDMIFKDVNIKELDYNGNHSVEVCGRLYNNGNTVVKTLPVKASLINENGTVIGEIIELLPTQHIIPGASTLFRIVADNPELDISKIKLSMENIIEK